MGSELDIVVTCTDRKSLPPRDGLRARDLPLRADGSPSVDEWLRRLRSFEGQRVPAEELYQGEAWTVSLEVARTARSLRSGSVRIWILSAGYGLVGLDHELAPYSATFSPESPDFVGGELDGREGTAAARRWWDELCSATRRRSPNSLEGLATGASGDVLLVLSTAYLRACRRDVVRAVSKSKRVVVLAPSAHDSRAIRHAAPPFDARLLTTRVDRERGLIRPIAQGSRMSLNGRVAQLLIEHFGDQPIVRAEATCFLAELTEGQPPLPTYDREDRTDQAVRRFIHRRLHDDPHTTKTALLREFRDSGHRCEQKRFGGLFVEVKSQLERVETA